jgi:hypothetical protein
MTGANLTGAEVRGFSFFVAMVRNEKARQIPCDIITPNGSALPAINFAVATSKR